MQLVANLYAVEGLNGAGLEFQLYSFDAPPVPDVEHALKAAENRLAIVARDPVVQVQLGSQRVIAHLPERSASLPEEVFVGPHRVALEPAGARRVSFPTTDEADLALAAAALRFTIRGELERSPRLWGAPGVAFERGDVGAETGPEILALPGVRYRVTTWDRKLHVVLEVLHRYVMRESLRKIIVENGDMDVGGRRALYRFGSKWYVIDMNNVLPSTVAEQVFRPPGREAITVLDYTKEKAGIRLDPCGHTLLYSTPSGEHRYGAAELAHLIVTTEVEEASRDHRRTILEPESRVAYLRKFIEKNLEDIRLGQARVRIGMEPSRVPVVCLATPRLFFGDGAELDPKGLANGLSDFGRAREQMLARHGPAVDHEFGPQALLVPQDDLSRDVVQDFSERLKEHVSSVAGRQWKPMLVLYPRRRGAKAQHEAMIGALRRARFEAGYCVAVLPANCPEYLHHRLKAEGWSALQFQCARADAVLRYYQNGRQVVARRGTDYDSYLRNLAYGILELNRVWGWVLADSLRHDIILGLDVLHNTAGLTILRRGGRDCRFAARRSKQGERLTTGDMYQLLVAEIREEVGNTDRPRSILLLRDGRTYDSEREGFDRAIRQLEDAGLLSHDLRAGIVEVHKTSAIGLRLAQETNRGLRNPPHGALHIPTDSEAFIITTGEPFLRQGTARPLHLVLAHGNLLIQDVAADAFDLAHLGWSSARIPTRLPVPVRLCDEFLGPIAIPAEELEEEKDDIDLPEVPE